MILVHLGGSIDFVLQYLKRGQWGQLIGLGERERRKGNKKQRQKIGERGRETRNRDVRLGTEDRRQLRNRYVREKTEDGRQGTEK
jgi:hypothetical protein